MSIENPFAPRPSATGFGKVTPLTFKVLSVLLCYPTAELLSALDDLDAVVQRDGLLDHPRRAGIRALVEHFRRSELLDLQERYVELFDRSRPRSLHLFEHVHGQSRDRGQAMVDLLEVYRRHGLVLSARELPDYLPLFLEFLSEVPKGEALELLGNAADILCALGARVAACDSHYGGVFEALAFLAGAPLEDTPPAGEKDPADDLAALDAAWEEEAVSFMASGTTCSTGAAEAKPVTVVRRGRQP